MPEPYATVQDHVNALIGDSGAQFERQPQADGSVIVRLAYPDGDVVTGRGASTAAAVAALAARLSPSDKAAA